MRGKIEEVNFPSAQWYILRFMSDISLPILLTVLTFLSFPLIGGYLAVKLKLSPLIGYILGGIALNILIGGKLPHQFINNFSMIGLILLIFTIGLETNLGLLKQFGKFVILGGMLQVILSGLFIFVLGLVFKLTFIESLFFGFAFALSSTAVVSKMIQERREESSLVGGLTIGVLIFQDLVFIPLLIIFSSFTKSASTIDLLTNMFVNVVKAILILFSVYYFGQKLVPLIFNKIAKVSREILNLFIVVSIVITLSFFSFFGLSSLLAAFISGILIGQTLEHYHIFSQMRPIRDLLTVVFFVFLGLTIEPSFIIQHLLPIFLFTSSVILIKIVTVLAIFLFFKFHSKTAFAIAISLFEIGEDAFILIYQGFINKSVSQENYYFALSVVLSTLILTPVLIQNRDRIYTTIRNLIKKYLPFVERLLIHRIDRELPNIDVLPLKNHVIVCGFGRVGRYVGRALMLANVPFIAIDYNFHTVEKTRKEGINIIYGDPTEIDVLDYAECDAASVVVSAVPDRLSQEMIVFNVKKLNSSALVFTRVHLEADQRRMKDLGVEVVVQPEFEASLAIVRKILLWKGIDKQEISRKIKRLKIEHGMI